MAAPVMTPEGVNWTRRYLPKREELSFRRVLALPNAEKESFLCQFESFCA